MNSRKEQLLSIRSIINHEAGTVTDIESFQNETLKPILKFQNELFIALFKDYIQRYKNVFYNLSIEGKLNYIENVIKKKYKI